MSSERGNHERGLTRVGLTNIDIGSFVESLLNAFDVSVYGTVEKRQISRRFLWRRLVLLCLYREDRARKEDQEQKNRLG